MIGVGKKAPSFHLPGALHDKVREYTLEEFRGLWLVIFFYPADFTFICPTEILGFQSKYKSFAEINTEIIGISVDPVERHVLWARELGGLSYPLLSDIQKIVARSYNVLDEKEGVAQRATFILNPGGIVQFEMSVAMNVGRSVEETYRVLRALQTGRLCPADWKPGEETGDLELKY